MQKILPVLLVMMFYVLTGCLGQQTMTKDSGDRESLISNLRSVTVALVTRDKDNDVVPYCTGVWVAEDKILTADHCAKAIIEQTLKIDASTGEHERTLVEMLEVNYEISYVVDSDERGVWNEPATIYAANVIKFDFAHDLALLSTTDSPSHRVTPLADRLPGQGEELHVMGMPSNLYWTYALAHVAAYREENLRMLSVTGPWLQVIGPVWKGNSGGGAFNSNGELVGIASRLAPMPNGSFFVHLKTIKSFLD